MTENRDNLIEYNLYVCVCVSGQFDNKHTIYLLLFSPV